MPRAAPRQSEILEGMPELRARVIDLYLAESPKLMERLKRAARVGDAAELAAVAHSLRSSSANVGAQALSRDCADLEAAARRADIDEAKRIAARVEAEHGCVQSALAENVLILTG
jgi:HPt (histidine-containing phosphotransfer) domain-containing protein